MTKHEKISFLKSFLDIWKELENLELLDQVDNLTTIYHRFLEKEGLPKMSADELLEHIRTAPFFGNVIKVHPRNVRNEEWDLYEPYDIKWLFRCEDTGAAYIQIYPSQEDHLEGDFVGNCFDEYISGSQEKVVTHLREHLN